MLHAMGEELTAEEVSSVFEKFDVDRSETIDLKEFVVGTTQYLWERHEHPSTKSEVSKAAMLHINKGESVGEDEEGDDEAEMPEELLGMDPAEQQRRLLQSSAIGMAMGTILVIIFSDPMAEAFGELGNRIGVNPFYVSFVLAPIASNASELIASYKYALKKTPNSISISLQALQGSACMNNTFCLAIFMALIFFKGLAWEYSAETLGILLAQCVVAFVSTFKTQVTIVVIYEIFTPVPLILIDYPLIVAPCNRLFGQQFLLELCTLCALVW
jgi:Ca2+/Na+ antiporter